MLPNRTELNHDGILLPILIEEEADGTFVVECPVLEGCYSQGKTAEEALGNIREVITLISSEPAAQRTLQTYRPRQFSLRAITVNV